MNRASGRRAEIRQEEIGNLGTREAGHKKEPGWQELMRKMKTRNSIHRPAVSACGHFK